MFGGFMKKMAGGDEQKAKKANDLAEQLSGKDLDGDGTVAGVPVQKPVAQAPRPTATAPQARVAAPGGAGGSAQGVDINNLLNMGKSYLTQSGRLKPSADGGGIAGLLNTFKNFSPEVQQKAEVQTKNLDDGRDIPLSKLNGNKKSLLIGINYFGTPNELKGCINDVKNVKNLITTKFKFPTTASNMRVLTDDQTDSKLKPTKANIIAGMKWLVEGAKSGDSLFIHYSGHGATAKDVSPDTDEADGQDETLVPADYSSAGMIIDDEIFDILVAPLPKGVRLTAVMDCCHSGSVFDLPYSYVFEQGRDMPVEVDNRKVAIAAALAAGKALMAKDYGGALKSLMEAGKAYMAMSGKTGAGAGGASSSASSSSYNNNNSSAANDEPQFETPSNSSSSYQSSSYQSQPAQDAPYVDPMASQNAAPSSSSTKLGSISTDANVSSNYISIRTTVCDCIQFSGCKDNQTSADAFIGGQSTGAMSYALIKALDEHGLTQTYSELLKNIRTILQGKYSQVPQMSTGHRMLDLDGTFEM